MATEIPIDETPTGGANPFVDALVAKGAWIDDDGGMVTIRVCFADGATQYGSVSGEQWLETEKAAGWSALSAWSAVANIQFVEAAAGEADITVWRVTDSEIASLPGGSVGGLGLSQFPWDPSDPLNVFFNSEGDGWTDPNGLDPGGYAYATLLHEFGHALGLAHPHGNDSSLPEGSAFPGVDSPGSKGTDDLNQGVFTVMTYNDGWQSMFPDYMPTAGNFGYGWQATPMAFDIAAIQAIYGAKLNQSTTDDIYALQNANEARTGWRSIWDTGGTDTISAVGATSSVHISLKAAPLSGPDAGGYVSYIDGIIGGLTIATSVRLVNGVQRLSPVVIENASGGDFADTLIGNNVSNLLIGGNGDDVLHGGENADQLLGGDGIDTASYINDLAVAVSLDNTVVSTGAALGDFLQSMESLVGSDIGSDVLAGDANNNAIAGGGGHDKLYGRDGDDTLDGGTGNDTLYGEAGANTIDGGEGFDFASYFSLGAIEIALNGSFATTGEAADDILTSIERLSGSNTGNDKLTGDAGVNWLYGNGGDDVLSGLGEADFVKGGRGKDSISGGSGNDTLRGESGDDTLMAGSGNDIIVGGSGKDSLSGSTGVDQFRYESRSDLGDSISAFSGSDTFAFKSSEFKNLKKGFLASENLILRNDNRALEKDDYFIFEKDSDRLWFDIDGSASKKPVLVADMASSVDLNVKDILII